MKVKDFWNKNFLCWEKSIQNGRVLNEPKTVSLLVGVLRWFGSSMENGNRMGLRIWMPTLRLVFFLCVPVIHHELCTQNKTTILRGNKTWSEPTCSELLISSSTPSTPPPSSHKPQKLSDMSLTPLSLQGACFDSKIFTHQLISNPNSRKPLKKREI